MMQRYNVLASFQLFSCFSSQKHATRIPICDDGRKSLQICRNGGGKEEHSGVRNVVHPLAVYSTIT
jgi:hypothetical protein